MEKVLIFKIAKGNEIWSVFRLTDSRTNDGDVFRVYCGRRWYGHTTWQTYQYAVASALRNALDLNIHGEEVSFL